MPHLSSWSGFTAAHPHAYQQPLVGDRFERCSKKNRNKSHAQLPGRPCSQLRRTNRNTRWWLRSHQPARG